LGDAGQRALIEFVGENDRVRASKAKSSLAVQEPEAAEVGADADSAEGDAE